ncbi:N-ethylmaleimide reductase [Aspergillus piperis CBS 112811]|uniref:N-ethylmaleimide reductase n=1 Tax=Aspergillus piperis CBS 112811 TaxID=1448313 RepID=A0A8G1VKV9_9EURO|nr:N-ethylmaleimide reductase [Aspergillus piperis CBS 112811]RAH55747.1 N-ethylmaleimide reductase [Aspergillus piperis CBS 112811]
MSLKLFQPRQVGKINLDHRVVMAPPTLPDTMIIAEATMISPSASGLPHAPGIWSEEQVEGWKYYLAFHFCQLIAVDRAADPAQLQADGGYVLHAPSPILIEPGMPIPKQPEENEVQQIIGDFATAAKNAIRAGFGGVEIHGANGYLVDQFLQDVSNNRNDQWGGSIPNRARFGLEVAKAVADAIGAERVGFRVIPWNTWQSMKMVDPVPQFAYFVERLQLPKLAYLHVIESRAIDRVDCAKEGSIQFLLDIWAMSTPVIVAGGYRPEDAETSMGEEYKDHLVTIAFRQHFIANHDLPFRIYHSIPNGYTNYPFSADFMENRIQC